MRISIMPFLLSVFFSMVITLDAWAGPLQSLNSIEHAAYEYAMEKTQSAYDLPQIVMGNLDSRLRLQACEEPLVAFTHKQRVGLGNQTIGVKCPSAKPWTVYVPVKVKLLKPVVVAAKAMSAKHILKATDVVVKQVDVGELRQGYLSDTALVVGQQLKYAIAMGTVIGQNAVKPEKIVRRGEMITLIAIAGGMQVKMNGTALSDASLGQRIRVKNSSSKRVIVGVVDAPGIVRVSL
jgi:flagellar basal body P-ring formation protein FlgA